MNDEHILNEDAAEIVEPTGNHEGETAVSENESPEDVSIEAQLAKAQEEVADFRDRWMRSQAEFANARKRMERQRIMTYQDATVELTNKLLPILDDFDRAMENVPELVEADSWFEGMQLVQRKMEGILEKFNVVPIEAVGHPFDPNLHEAITQEPSDEYESGVVVRELQKGYMVGDRVIRPSLVCVAQ